MDISGHYNWIYANGKFPVCLRPSGVLFCPQFPTSSSWTVDNDNLFVNFGKYGTYTMKSLGPTNKLFEGHLTTNPSDWRKMEYVSPLSATETLLVGDGGGSVWEWEWEKGTFEVEFLCDAINHFVCKKFPSHSHWSLNDNTVEIDWGKYGQYQLVIDPFTKTMTGHGKDNKSNWRKAKFIRPLGNNALGDAPSHDHAGHEHGPSCGSGCGH